MLRQAGREKNSKEGGDVKVGARCENRSSTKTKEPKEEGISQMVKLTAGDGGSSKPIQKGSIRNTKNKRREEKKDPWMGRTPKSKRRHHQS